VTAGPKGGACDADFQGAPALPGHPSALTYGSAWIFDQVGTSEATIEGAGRVTAGLSRLEESPDTAGQDAGATQAAKADGKWHRKETACSDSPETLKVRVKRWGKSPPASWRHGG
jgi:hypothetical protein